MAVTKPTTVIEWCTSNPTDPTSGQPAIIAPSSGKKASGFTRLEEPPRQDLNWLFNLTDQWNDYFEAVTDDHEANLEEIADAQYKPNDLAVSSTVLKTALDARYLGEDTLEGFRIVDIIVIPGSQVIVKLSIGRARLNNGIASSRTIMMPSNSYLGNTNTLTKTFVNSAVIDPYSPGSAQGCAGSSTTLSDNTWYHVFAIYDGNTQDWDFAISDDETGSDCIFGANGAVRRVASLYYLNVTEGFRSVRQFGDYFFYDKIGDETSNVLSHSVAGSGVVKETSVSISSFLPPVDVLAHLKITAEATGTEGGSCAIGSAIEPDYSGASAQYFTARADCVNVVGIADGQNIYLVEKTLITPGSNRILKFWDNQAIGGTTSFLIAFLGYYDLRGKDWGYSVDGSVSYIRGT